MWRDYQENGEGGEYAQLLSAAADWVASSWKPKGSCQNGSRLGAECSSGREEIPLSKIAPGDRIEEPWLKPETKKRFGRSEMLCLPSKI